MPVGPEFQDPPPVANEPPYVVLASTYPFPWTVQQLTTTAGQPFTLVAGDANLNDQITVRWMANYPPYNPSTSQKLMDVTSGDRGGQVTFSFPPQPFVCGMFPKAADNILTALVSDRGFLDLAPGLAQNAMLPYSYDAEDIPQPVNTIVGWRIIGCQ